MDRRAAAGAGRAAAEHLVRGELRFFRPRGGGHFAGRPSSGEPIDWADIFVCLAGAGFGGYDALVRRTRRQLTLLYDRVQRQQRLARADQLEDGVLAAAGTKKSVREAKKLIDELRKDE